jgi:Methyltransferase domain
VRVLLNPPCMTANGSAPGYEFRRWARAAATAARDPLDGLERVRERVAAIRQSPRPSIGLQPDAAGEKQLHALLGIDWPCDVATTFNPLWQSILKSLERQGLEFGRGAYSGWDDADPGFARAAWCLTRHGAARAVVETGVARGLTSRVILEALSANGSGRLCSIDLPLAMQEPSAERELGAAVSERLKRRWTLVRGSSRRRLPRLLEELGTIDLFVHDSRHSDRNVAFELTRAWGALRPGGFLLVDDVHHNHAFASCVKSFGMPPAIACSSDDGKGVFGVIRKPDAAGLGAV